MGVIYSSYEYPKDKSKIVKLEDIPTFPTNESSDGTFEVSSQNFALHQTKLRDHFDAQIDNLKSHLNMYFLFDSYDKKNGLILKDLEKKLVQQKKDLLKDTEYKDIMSENISIKNEEIEKQLRYKKIYIFLIVFFIILIIASFIFIVIKLDNYSDYNQGKLLNKKLNTELNQFLKKNIKN